MNFNFEVILFYAAVVTGVIFLIDCLFFAKSRRQKAAKMPVIIDYARSFFPVLVIVFLLRSFVFEPFRIPSGSLEPTLLIGDFILVSKYEYGVRLPIIHKKVIDYHLPKHGDIILFRWPPNPSFNFIKRVVGVPGDKISYIDKVIYINGKKMPQEILHVSTAQDEMGGQKQVDERIEDLLGVKHHIFVDSKRPSRDFKDVVVPENSYFVMGDNRDDSADSRFWGFVPEANIIGKAERIWMSWENIHSLRFERIGKKID